MTVQACCVSSLASYLICAEQGLKQSISFYFQLTVLVYVVRTEHSALLKSPPLLFARHTDVTQTGNRMTCNKVE